MRDDEIEQHLSQINTQITLLEKAHKGDADEAAAARQILMRRYYGAVFRYLLRAVRDVTVAEDLTQEFALRFVQGRFGNVNPEKGRFRNYVKGALFRLVQDHYRVIGRMPKAVSLDFEAEPAAGDENAAAEQEFRDSWRQEILSRAWKALAQVEAQTGQPYHEVMRFRVDHQDLSSADIAERLAEKHKRSFTAAGVRQLVHRGRERFAELLLDDIREALEGASMDRIREELAELNLLKYCKDILDRKHGS